MYAYIARQPIFDRNRKVSAYELLYRDEENPNEARIMDGSRATSRLMSDAITVFGLSELTNEKPAYINFTERLLFNDFALLASPREIVVELLEDIVVTESLLAKVRELKEKGYRLALDDFVSENGYEALLPLIDVVKVDFRLTDVDRQKRLARLRLLYPNITLLAEKVETEEEFLRASKQGYQYFQGYFFARPQTMSQKLQPLAATSYGRLLAEINRSSGLDFSNCAKIIHNDTTLTYRILKKVHALQYYRGNQINGVMHALVMLGEEETRRWILLVLARENNVTKSEELVRHAYMRGLFAKRLSECRQPMIGRGEDAFLMGMFSLLGEIFGCGLHELLDNVDISGEVRRALLGEEENYYSMLLNFVKGYENGEELNTDEMHFSLPDVEISNLYLRCLMQADQDFESSTDSGEGA